MRLILIIAIWVMMSPHCRSQQYIPAPASEVTFTIKNLGISVRGRFQDLTGTIYYDPAVPSATSFDIIVPVRTLDTGIELRDRHLRKEEYFFLDQHPEMRFVSTEVTLFGASGTVKGVLTIRDKSRPIEVKCAWKILSNEMHWDGTFQIDRRDFGVGGGSFSMGDNVQVQVSLRCKPSGT